MAFFKKQRLRYQEWLNSFVVRHHDEWYMPLITIGLGVSYIIAFIVTIVLLSTILALMVKLIGWWVLYMALTIWAVYGVGMFVRLPGDCQYDMKKNL